MNRQSGLENRLRDAVRQRTTLAYDLPGNAQKVLGVVREALSRNPVPDPDVDHLLVQRGSTEQWFALTQSIGIGASAENDVQLDSSYISREHCLLEKTDAGWLLRDVGSMNKVYVNGEETKERLLRDGDIIQLAEFSLMFLAGTGPVRFE